MQRKMELDGTNERHQYLFSMLMDAFLLRGNPARDARTGEAPRQSKDDHRSEARIKKALEAISEPKTVDDQGKEIPGPKPGHPDMRRRVLKSEVVSLVLDQPEHARLLKYVTETQWVPHIVDLAMELEDQLEAAEKV